MFDLDTIIRKVPVIKSIHTHQAAVIYVERNIYVILLSFKPQ